MITNHRYEVIIYWSKADQAFIAEVPELSGCMADGQTYLETIDAVQVVIDEWIQTALELGRAIPEPIDRESCRMGYVNTTHGDRL